MKMLSINSCACTQKEHLARFKDNSEESDFFTPEPY